MAGLVPAIHALSVAKQEGVDALDKPAHDAESLRVARPG